MLFYIGRLNSVPCYHHNHPEYYTNELQLLPVSFVYVQMLYCFLVLTEYCRFFARPLNFNKNVFIFMWLNRFTTFYCTYSSLKVTTLCSLVLNSILFHGTSKVLRCKYWIRIIHNTHNFIDLGSLIFYSEFFNHNFKNTP